MLRSSKALLNTAFFYAIAAMAGGVFYREYTKFNGFSGRTTLGFVHTHLFMLGMFAFLLMFLLNRQFSVTERKTFPVMFWVYNAGLVITAGMLIWRGILQVSLFRETAQYALLDVIATPPPALPASLDAAISGVAGIGHILLGTGLIWFFVLLKKQFSAIPEKKA